MIHIKSRVFLGAALAVVLFSTEADAHWCNDLWGSAYNLVVRPESDTVTVPSSGSASLNVYVQNNMEYALDSFSLVADIGGTAITAKAASQVASGKLMPGEKQKYTLTVTKSGGGSVNATDINFSVTFGGSGQSNMYGSAAATGAKAAMIKKTDGTLFPAAPPPGLGTGSSMTQGTQLLYSAAADFGDTANGLDKLVNLYCAGRGSWNSGSATPIKSNCPDTTTTVCPTTTPTSGNGSKYDYMHLWAAGELAIRKSKLDTRAGVLRTRLQCGIKDDNNGFAGFALMVLGYLGEDSGARTFIEGKISAGGDLGTIAKAALLLMGNADDLSKYKADVTTGTSASSIFVKAACAAALGIAAKDDATVKSVLFPLTKWTEPDTSDNGQAIYAAQLLNLVAWDRRGWAPQAGDTGAVSFYGETGTPGNGGNGGGTGGATGSGGAVGSGGATGSAGSGGNKDASPGSDAKVVAPDTVGNGGATGIGGATGNGGTTGGGGKTGAGGATSAGGATAAGGTTVVGGATGTAGATSAGGATGAGGTTGAAGSKGTGGSSVALGGTSGGEGGANGAGGDTGSGTTPVVGDTTGCKCNLGGHGQSTPSLSILAMAGLAWLVGRRRRR